MRGFFILFVLINASYFKDRSNSWNLWNFYMFHATYFLRNLKPLAILITKHESHLFKFLINFIWVIHNATTRQQSWPGIRECEFVSSKTVKMMSCIKRQRKKSQRQSTWNHWDVFVQKFTLTCPLVQSSLLSHV